MKRKGKENTHSLRERESACVRERVGREMHKKREIEIERLRERYIEVDREIEIEREIEKEREIEIKRV